MKLNILLLCNKPSVGRDANTIVDHIEAFEQYSEHTIWLYSNLGDFSKKLDLTKFDAIIIHYSLFILSKRYLTSAAKKQLRDYTGMKVIFIQDEYRQINHMVDALADLKMDIVFTCFPESEFEAIYPSSKLPNVSKYNNLTGYVPKRLTEVFDQPPIENRSLDVGYRGRQLPYWYGELGCDKWKIVENWHQTVPKTALKTDISYHEADRFYGEQWQQFLVSCKTMLGVESGTSVMDFTGELEKKVDAHQLIHPHDSFETIQKKYFLAEEGRHQLNQISPRCFEAIALKTVLVLYEGAYSNILIPGRHYIALKKDFSNIDEVLAHIKDDDFLQNMADTAYQEIALNPQYSYQAFIQKVDNILQKEFVSRGKSRIASTYAPKLFNQHIRSRTLKNSILLKASAIYKTLPFSIRLMIKNVFRQPRLKDHVFKGLYWCIRIFRKNKMTGPST